MKKLNEVIKALECCCEIGLCKTECPYHDDCADGREKKDAIYYLKEYQRYQNTPSCIGKMIALDLENNEALKWDELKQMIDCPIWLEEREMCDDPFVGNWRLVNCIEMFRNEKDTERIMVTGPELESYAIYRIDMGEYWRAYRNEHYEKTE